MTAEFLARLKALKREVHALALAAVDPRTPWPAKAVAALVLAYALSPVDLIPDFIPVLGYLDDLVIVPAGLWLCRRLIPDQVMADARARAAQAAERPAKRPWGVVLVAAVWLGLAALAWRWAKHGRS